MGMLLPRHWVCGSLEAMAVGRRREPDMQSWTQWQADVVATLCRELRDCLHHVALDDVDWVSWRSFYLEGRSPRAAVDRALERDF